MKKKTTQEYPSKKTLNLCIKEKASINWKLGAPLLVLVLAAAVLFAKFAVIDRMLELSRANARIAEAKHRVEELTEATANYDEVSLEYAKYSIHWMSDEERYLVARTEMIDLVNEELMNTDSSVRKVSMSGNKLSVELNNASLESTSSLVEKLSARDDVQGVAVYSAKSENGKANIVSVVITMLYQEEAN